MTIAKVLVVEDDDDLRFALTMRLRFLGYDVVEARDGYSAVSVANHELPDVVLLDLGLPGGDGVSVLDRYSRITACSTIPVVVLTGRDPVVAAAEVARFGVAGLLTKPADTVLLSEALSSALATSRRPRAQGSDDAPAAVAEDAEKRSRVLVVEDDPDLRLGLVLRLESLGYDVVQAGDGYSAVSVASHEQPDVVLLDLGLPGGDGVSVLQRYAHMGPLNAIPVVVLTGRDPVRAAEDVSDFHVWALLQKPADNAQLAEALASALHQRPIAAAVPGEA